MAVQMKPNSNALWALGKRSNFTEFITNSVPSQLLQHHVHTDA